MSSNNTFKTKTIEVTIKGISPMLQHRWSEEAEAESGAKTRTVSVDRGSPREQAESVVYRTKKGEIYFPGTWISGCLRNAGVNHKQKGSRKSVAYLVPAAVVVLNDVILVHDKHGKSIDDFEVDSRPVTIPATKGKIMRHRPRLDEWYATFLLQIEEDVLGGDFIHQLLTEAGRRVGVGDFRPAKFGPFGRFMVTSWEETIDPALRDAAE